MLLKLYRSNQPYTVFLVAFLAFAVSVPLLFYPYQHITPVYSVLNNTLAGIEFNPLLLFFSSAILVFIAAVIADRIFNQNEFMSDQNHLPAMWYCVLVAPFLIHPSALPILAGNIFVLIGAGRLVQVFRQPRVLAQYFEAGFWVGTASLFYMPFLLLIPILFLAIIYTRTFNGQEMIMPAIGAFVPWFFYFSISFILSDVILLEIPSAASIPLEHENMVWLFIILAMVIWQILVGLAKWFGSYGRSSNRSKNTKSVFLIFSGGMLLSALPLILTDSFLMLCVLSISFAFILSFSSVKQRRDWLPRLYFSITFLSLLLLFLVPLIKE